MAKKKRTRRQFTAEQKAAILRRHLMDKVPVSDLCDEYKLQPSVFYGWQRQALDNLTSAVSASSGRKKASREAALEKQIAALEARLAKRIGRVNGE